MYFANRHHAAVELARQLEHYKGKQGVILAVPRGGVPIGHYLAKHLDFTLDLLMTKKIGHPLHKEYAIGAVGLEDSVVEEADTVKEDYIDKEITQIRQQLKERYHKLMGDREPVPIRGKIAIVVDDGVATGRTVLATLKMLRSKRPEKLVVAVPVASFQAAERIQKEVDDFVCLYVPSSFQGVGRFYEDFSQVKDSEVLALLRELHASGHVA